MIKRLILFILMSALTASFAQADSAPQIESFTLKNGLEVIVIPNHRVPAVSHMLWYRVGGADDPPGKSGLAHYHEHMMFEGTINHKAGEYADIITRHGGQQNAFTAHDATCYYVDIAKSELPLVMELEADRMRGLSPTGDQAAHEKEVIIEERRMRIENSPDALLSEQMDAALFRNHPYHWPVIGWLHEMEGLTAADVLKLHQIYYHPNNAVLIISGDVTAREVKPLAEKYYGALPGADIPARVWREEPPQIAARRVTLAHVNVREPGFSRIYAAPSLVHGAKDESLPLFVLAQIMGGGKTSRLYQSLVVEQKIATDVDTSYDGFTLGPSQFEISALPAPNVTLEALEQAIDKALIAFQNDPIKPEELSRAKTLLKAESIYARDSLSGMALIMGEVRTLGLSTDYFSRWPQLIDAVTPQQIIMAAKDTLIPEKSVTGYLLPKEGAPLPMSPGGIGAVK